MRVFFGIELPDTVKNAAGRNLARVQKRIEQNAPRASIRWVSAANLHITLWFIGEASDERVEQLSTAARLPFSTRAFKLRFGNPGAFPPSGAPRVIWIGIASGAEQLRSLYEELHPRLTSLGYEAESRPYSPHLTIGRVKDIPRIATRLVRAALEEPIQPFESDVAAVTLFRSRLSPRGAQYEPLLRVPLA